MQLSLILLVVFLSKTNSYTPMRIVRQIHALPHYGDHFTVQSSTFGLSYTNAATNDDYVLSIYRLPLICGGIGICAVVIFQLAWTARACFRKLKCLPIVLFSPGAEAADDGNIGESPASIPMVRNLYIAFLVFGFCAIFANQAQIWGSEDLNTGVDISQSALDYIQDVFDGLSLHGTELQTNTHTLSTLFTNAAVNCGNAQTLVDSIPQYSSTIDTYQDYVDPVSGICTIAENILYVFAKDWKDKTLWSMYGMVNFSIFTYLVGIWLKGPRVLRFSVQIAIFVMLGLFLFCGIEMAILVRKLDFLHLFIIFVINS